jgi:diguanylate cyclase (GGDEF)-like protein/PAS domain S-box-containing protein
MGFSMHPKKNIHFSIKLVLGVAVISVLGLSMVFATVNTLVRGTIYDNVIEIAERDKIIYAGEIDMWFAVANQTVESLASSLRALPSVEHFPAIAAAFTADFGFVENVFIGFADGSVFNGIGWTPSDVGDDLGGVAWGPWQYWEITDRPWFEDAKAAGEGVTIVTEPYMSLTTGNITAAIATWLPDLAGIGASVGFSVSLDFIADALNMPVMGGYLMLLGTDGTIIFHQNPIYSPCSSCVEGKMHNLRAIPNGQFLMDSMDGGIKFAEFYDHLLGSSYFIATTLGNVDWTLVAVIPTAATLLQVYEDLSIVMIAITVIVIGLLVFTLIFVILLTRSMEERRTSEEKLRIIIDNMPMVSNISGRDSSIIECNKEGPRLFGLRDKQEYIDRFFELQPEFQPDGSNSMEKALAVDAVAFEKGTNRFEWMHQHINGELIPCEVTLTRVKWRGEDHLLSFVRDLRDFYAAQKRERLVMERMQAMLDSSPLACAILDENFNVLEVNQELLNLFCMTDMHDYISRFFDFSPKHQPDGRLSREKWKEKAELSLKAGKAHFEWMYQTLDGKTIPCEMTIVCITRDQRKLLIGYMRDLREINEAVSMMKQFEELAFTDALTNTRNRRYFTETAERELQICLDKGLDFAIILFDIDSFKRVNDTHGHDIGDEVLKIVAMRARNALKRDTLLARYGGEEFVVMLSNVSHENAVKIAWQIQQRIQDFPVASKNLELDITVSVGVASACKSAGSTTLQEIVKNADKALYHAKETGKNKVVSYEALKAPPASAQLT